MGISSAAKIAAESRSLGRRPFKSEIVSATLARAAESGLGASAGCRHWLHALIASAHDSGVRKPATPASAQQLEGVRSVRGEERSQGLAACVARDQRLDGDLRLELCRAAGNGEHQVAVVGRQQLIENRTVDFCARPRMGEVGQRSKGIVMPCSAEVQSTTLVLGGTTSTPMVPSRSTTVAAPPPVVDMTATRWRLAGGGLRAARAARTAFPGCRRAGSRGRGRTRPPPRRSPPSRRCARRPGPSDFRAAELVCDDLLAGGARRGARRAPAAERRAWFP